MLSTIEERYVSDKSKHSMGWVKTAKGVVNQLETIQTSLEAIGIYYQKYKDRNNKTFVMLGDAKFTGYEEYRGHEYISNLVKGDFEELEEDLDF